MYYARCIFVSSIPFAHAVRPFALPLCSLNSKFAIYSLPIKTDEHERKQLIYAYAQKSISDCLLWHCNDCALRSPRYRPFRCFAAFVHLQFVAVQQSCYGKKCCGCLLRAMAKCNEHLFLYVYVDVDGIMSVARIKLISFELNLLFIRTFTRRVSVHLRAAI